jgi:hypothetical protein
MIRFALLASMLALSTALATQPTEEKFYKLVHTESGKVLGTEGDSHENVTQAVLAADEASENRQWKIVKDGDHFKIVHRQCGKVLDVCEFSSEEGAKIILYDDKDAENDNQRWSWVGVDDDRRIKSKSSGLVFDIDDGKIVQKKEAGDNKKQLWKLVEVK